MNKIKAAIILVGILSTATATAGPVEFNSKTLAAAIAVSTLKAAGHELAGKCKNGVLAFSINGEKGGYVGLELRRAGDAWRVHDAAVSEQCIADLRAGEKQ